MLACRMIDGSPRVVEDHPDPIVSDGHVLVDVSRVAITLRDVVAIRRCELGIERLPDVLGHACIGTIATGGGDGGFHLGERVAIWPDMDCGACDLCTSGLRSHCRNKRVMGLRGAEGVLRERISVPIGCCVRLDADISDDEALLSYPLASALQAARSIGTSGHVSVLGATSEAVITSCVMHAQNSGARLLTASPSALDACEKMGVPHRDIREAGRRADQDCVIDCTASSRGLATALELVRPGGRVVMVASPPAEPFDLAPVVEREIRIEGCKPASLRAALEYISRGAINLEGLITTRVPMARAHEAFARVLEVGQLQVVVDLA
ncbi:MAG: zinc-dependent alcohol dehydrogenase [Planctomycetota bacterium]|jgi:threonine dehydrogenase-like Zn-dependent dehydrogenase